MFQIRELSGRTNVPARTIRYYEDIGLLAPARRSANGYRLYDGKDAERLGFIRSARSRGLSTRAFSMEMATGVAGAAARRALCQATTC